MSVATRVNRKADDKDIIRLNSVGLPLSTIGRELGCHPTTITLRLQSLKITPADTRRSFMEEVWYSLSPAQQDWLVEQLGPHHSIKDFVKSLIVNDFLRQQAPTKAAA